MKKFREKITPQNEISYQEYLEGTKKVLDASREERKLYTIKVAGKEFIVHPDVFSPKYFKDTEEFAKHLPVIKGEEILEIGAGTGAISIIAVDKGASKVVAIDINPKAVKNTRQNIRKHNLQDRIEVRQGDLYEPLKEDEKFDTIFWNTPFGLVEDEDIDDLEKAVYDPGYKSTERFITEASRHLKENGRLLIGFSSTLGRLDLLRKFADKANFNLKKLYEFKSVETHPVKFEIFEATQKSN